MLVRKKPLRQLILDFETFYDVKYSLTSLGTIQYVYDERFLVHGVGARWRGEGDAVWYGKDDAEDFIRSVDWENTEVVCHNANFDGFILTQHYGVHPASYKCTAAMARAHAPNSKSSLEAVAARILQDPSMEKGQELILTKGLRDLPPEIEDKLATYCRNDIYLTEAILNYLEPKIPQSEQRLIDLTTRMMADPLLVPDIERLKTFHTTEKERAEDLIEKSGVPRATLSSNPKFAAHLESLGLDVPLKISPRTGKSIPALGQKDYGYVNLVADHPEHRALWDARQAAKSRIQETRALRFIEAETKDNRIPMPLLYYGAHTGRFSGSERMNVQNMPRGSELRLSLCAEDDKLVYVIDLSQIEARMLAWLAGEDQITAVFAANGDIYSEFASIVYDRPINKTDDPEERFVGKTCILGLGYGLGAEKFWSVMNIGTMGPPVVMSRREAQRIVQTYRSTYQKIRSFWKRCDELRYAMCDPQQWGTKYGPLTVEREALVLPNGLKLQYPGLIESNGQSYKDKKGFTVKLYGGKLAENITQALARIVITDAMLKIDEKLRSFEGCGVVLTVHDEVVGIGPADGADQLFDEIHNITVTPPDWCKDLPLAAEGGHAKEYSK
jgi:DNA polymerase